jgi:hypothetical protein
MTPGELNGALQQTQSAEPDVSGESTTGVPMYWFAVKWRNWCREIRSKIIW